MIDGQQPPLSSVEVNQSSKEGDTKPVEEIEELLRAIEQSSDKDIEKAFQQLQQNKYIQWITDGVEEFAYIKLRDNVIVCILRIQTIWGNYLYDIRPNQDIFDLLKENPNRNDAVEISIDSQDYIVLDEAVYNTAGKKVAQLHWLPNEKLQ